MLREPRVEVDHRWGGHARGERERRRLRRRDDRVATGRRVPQQLGRGAFGLFVGHHTLDVDPVTKAALPSRNPLTGKDEENGTSLIDVTDPANPKTLFHIPIADGKGGGAQMVRAVDGNGLPAKDGKVYMLRSYHSAAHEIWDVTDPNNPKGVRTVRDGNPLVGAQTGAPGALATTHKSWWEPDTGIAYVVGSRGSDKDAGWRTGHG